MNLCLFVCVFSQCLSSQNPSLCVIFYWGFTKKSKICVVVMHICVQFLFVFFTSVLSSRNFPLVNINHKKFNIYRSKREKKSRVEAGSTICTREIKCWNFVLVRNVWPRCSPRFSRSCLLNALLWNHRVGVIFLCMK